VRLPFTQTALLGALAGFTIYLSLPVGRLDNLGSRARVALAMFSVGVLAFLFVDVLSHAQAIVGKAVDDLKAGNGSLGNAVGLAALLAAGFTAGTAGLALLERRMRPRSKARPPIAGGATEAMTVEQAEVASLHDAAEAARRNALRIGMTVAAAIGLHNFAEGLAIGVSAKAGEVGLATVLIIGFALHNATEGFGITAPLAGGERRPSWLQLGLLGLIGGVPTLIGTLLGGVFVSELVSVIFLALAAGSILYVIVQLVAVSVKLGRGYGFYFGVFAGILAGFATDFVVTAAGV